MLCMIKPHKNTRVEIRYTQLDVCITTAAYGIIGILEGYTNPPLPLFTTGLARFINA